MGKYKVLLIDDTPSRINLIRKILKKKYDVFISTGGDLAISKTEIITPDLILLDILIPGIDGFETIKRIKSNNKIKHIPIIFMTAVTDVSGKAKAFELGAVDYINKPINVEEFTDLVNTHLKLGGYQKVLISQEKEFGDVVTTQNELFSTSEERYKILFDESPVSLWKEDISEVKKLLNEKRLEGVKDLMKYIDDNLEFVYKCFSKIKVIKVNKATLDLFAAESFNHLIDNLDKTIMRSSINVLKRVLTCLYNGKYNFREEIECFNLKGEKFSAFIQCSTLYAKNLLLVSIINIDRIKKTERKLKESEDRLKEAQRRGKMGHWDIDLNNKKIELSDEVKNIFEIKETGSKFHYSRFLEIMHLEDKKNIISDFLSLSEQNEEFNIPSRILLNNKIKYLMSNCKISYDDYGQPISAHGIVQDITSQKEVEIKLEKSIKETEARELILNRILDTFHNGVFMCSKDLTIEYVNSALEKKYSKRILGKKCYKEIFHFDEKCKWCNIDNLRTTKHSIIKVKNPVDNRFHEIKRILLKTGSVLNIFEDLTQQIKSEEEIKKLIITNSMGLVEYTNKKHRKITGYNEKEVIDKVLPILDNEESSKELVYYTKNDLESKGECIGELQCRKTNVIVAEDHEFFRAGLVLALKDIDFVNIVADVSNGKELVDLVKIVSVDIVLTDIKMPVMDGLEATKIIKNLYPDIKVVILTLHDEEDYFKKMIEYGIHGYILKNTNKDNLERALHLIDEGKQYFAEELLPILTNNFKSSTSDNNKVKLTKRELEVLQQIALGITNVEIAEKLFISTKTVINHRTNIMTKTSMHNSAGLISYAYKNNLI